MSNHASGAHSGDKNGFVRNDVLAGTPEYAVRHVLRMPCGGQGWAGQGWAGQGRAGQGRAGQGRAGQGSLSYILEIAHSSITIG